MKRFFLCVAWTCLIHACGRTAPPDDAAEPGSPNNPLPEYLDSLDVHHVAWSHDGLHLAFTATYRKQIDVYVARVDGSRLRRVTDGSSLRVGQLNLSWLPGDKGLLFLCTRGDTIRLCRIGPSGADVAELPNPAMHTAEGDVSPDGRQIAFVNVIDRRHQQLFVRNVDGSNVRPLTTTGGAVRADGNPAWSPDGRFIVFDSIRDSTGNGEIFRINADGTDERRLTTNSVNDALPHWSADGQHITWVQIANRRATLVESDPTGGHFRKIADDVNAGTYSPDGAWIAAAGRADDPSHWFVVTVRSDGSEKRRVVLHP